MGTEAAVSRRRRIADPRAAEERAKHAAESAAAKAAEDAELRQ